MGDGRCFMADSETFASEAARLNVLLNGAVVVASLVQNQLKHLHFYNGFLN